MRRRGFMRLAPKRRSLFRASSGVSPFGFVPSLVKASGEESVQNGLSGWLAELVNLLVALWCENSSRYLDKLKYYPVFYIIAIFTGRDRLFKEGPRVSYSEWIEAEMVNNCYDNKAVSNAWRICTLLIKSRRDSNIRAYLWRLELSLAIASRLRLTLF